MSAPGSTIPAVLDALVGLFGDTFAEETGLEVFEGLPVVDVGSEILAIGLSATADPESTDGSLMQAGLGTEMESYAVHSVLIVASGDDDLAAPRQRAFELFARARAALAEHGTGGVPGVVRMRIGDVGYESTRDKRGVRASVAFAVYVTAYL